jgi:hypothetical protein
MPFAPDLFVLPGLTLVRTFKTLTSKKVSTASLIWYLLAFNLLAFVVLGRLGSLGGHSAYEWLFLSFGIQLNVMLFLTVRRYLLDQRKRLPYQSALSLVSSLPPNRLGWLPFLTSVGSAYGVVAAQLVLTYYGLL